MERIIDHFTTDNLILVLAACGAYKLLVSPTLSLISGIYKQFLRPRVYFKKRYGENTWVMITGATNGIGLGFAEVFAQQGFNLIIVGRSPDKLFNCKAELEKKFPEVLIETRMIDLMSTNIEDYIELGQSVSNLDVSILINNAGYYSLSPLESEEYSELERMININTGPYVYLTRSILPQMLNRNQRSAIIFTTSITATAIRPCLSTYAATKVFNHHFSQSLAYEISDKVDVLSFRPGAVSTQMSGKLPSFQTLTVSEAVSGALDALGRDIETKGYWRHVVTSQRQDLALCFMPKSWAISRVEKRLRAAAKARKEKRHQKETIQ